MDTDLTNRFLLTYYFIILIIGIICHTLTFIAFTLHRNLRKSTSNMIFLNLAAANTCTLLWTIPVSIASRILGKWPWNTTNDAYSGPTCDFSATLDNSVAVASIWTLALYAADRLIYIVYPLQYYHKMKRRRAIVALVCIWAYSVGLSLPPVFKYNKYIFGNKTYTCGLGVFEHDMFLIFFVGAFPIPIFTICCSYICIGIIAREYSKKESQLIGMLLYKGNATLIDKAKKHIKSTIVVTAVILGTMICILPIFMSMFIIYIVRPDMEKYVKTKWSGISNTICTTLFLSNSCVNIIIFGTVNKELRKAVIGIFECQQKKAFLAKKPKTHHGSNRSPSPESPGHRNDIVQ